MEQFESKNDQAVDALLKAAGRQAQDAPARAVEKVLGEFRATRAGHCVAQAAPRRFNALLPLTLLSAAAVFLVVALMLWQQEADDQAAIMTEPARTFGSEAVESLDGYRLAAVIGGHVLVEDAQGTQKAYRVGDMMGSWRIEQVLDDAALLKDAAGNTKNLKLKRGQSAQTQSLPGETVVEERGREGLIELSGRLVSPLPKQPVAGAEVTFFFYTKVAFDPAQIKPETVVKTTTDERGCYTVSLETTKSLYPCLLAVKQVDERTRWVCTQYFTRTGAQTHLDGALLARPGLHYEMTTSQMAESFTVRGRVTNTDGQPLAGVQVDLQEYLYWFTHPELAGGVETDDDGRYALPDWNKEIAFNLHMSWGQTPRWESWRYLNSVTISEDPAGGKMTVHDFVFPVGDGEIAGTVRDEAGKPVAQANVYCTVYLTPSDSVNQSAQTDAEGHFRFSGLPRTLNISTYITALGYMPSESTPRTLEAEGGWDVTLKSVPQLQLTVRGAQGKPVLQINVNAVTLAHATGDRVTYGSNLDRSLQADNGVYRLGLDTRTLEADLMLQVRADGYEMARITVDLSSQEAFCPTVELRPIDAKVTGECEDLLRATAQAFAVSYDQARQSGLLCGGDSVHRLNLIMAIAENSYHGGISVYPFLATSMETQLSQLCADGVFARSTLVSFAPGSMVVSAAGEQVGSFTLRRGIRLLQGCLCVFRGEAAECTLKMSLLERPEGGWQVATCDVVEVKYK